MRESALAARRRALVEKLVQAVTDHTDADGVRSWAPVLLPRIKLDAPTQEQNAIEALRARFTALLASRWQT